MKGSRPCEKAVYMRKAILRMRKAERQEGRPIST